MTDNRFKGALEEFNSCIADDEDGSGYLWDAVRGIHGETIREALKIADRLMHEPSEGMVTAGREAFLSYYMLPANELPDNVATFALSAMVKQLLTEIQND